MARKTGQSSAKKNAQPGRVRTWLAERWDARRPAVARAAVWLVIISAVIVSAAAAMDAMETHVRRHRIQAAAVRYRVELEGVPDWAPASLVRQVLSDVTPQAETAPYFEDDDLCRVIYDQAIACPWIASVESVHRDRLALDSGVVRVRATWRCAVAYVPYEQKQYFVDAEGYVLPDHQVPRWAVIREDGRTRCYLTSESIPVDQPASAVHYFAVTGVTTPPPAPGRQWRAEDLQAGLRLARLVVTRPWANQIAEIDVRNHSQRINTSDPELQMIAQVRMADRQSLCTKIRFGRFPHDGGGDWVITPERKMAYLDRYVDRHDGYLAGMHAALDVRLDDMSASPYAR